MHSLAKPLSYSTLGHYRASYRHAIIAGQAANSRLFELRNTHATNLIVIHSVEIKWQQTAAHTAAIEDSLDLYRVTGFSAVDTTNTVTPTASVLRTSMAAAPGGAALRGVTVTGATAGMTGWAGTKDTYPLMQVPMWLLAAVPTAGASPQVYGKHAPKVEAGEHPLVLVQNEGIMIENRVGLGAAAGSMAYYMIEWAEVTAF
jgi:hypothetical protein